MIANRVALLLSVSGDHHASSLSHACFFVTLSIRQHDRDHAAGSAGSGE